MLDLSDYDRLLLAFADFCSYGIVARAAVDGSPSDARLQVQMATRLLSPFAPADYVYSRQVEEQAAFDDDGRLIRPLVLHIGNEDLSVAIRTSLIGVSLPVPERRLVHNEAVLVLSPLDRSR
jgi:hypothetical protein